MFSVENFLDFALSETKKMACQAHSHSLDDPTSPCKSKPGSLGQTPVTMGGRNLWYKVGFGFFFNFNPPLWGSWM